MDVKELKARVEELGWYHSIDLGHGIVTPGLSRTRLPDSMFPPLAGRSVLDIGAWDGLYSFTAERLGASQVVALDHYAWGVDIHARQQYWDECRRKGVLPDQERDEADFFRPDLPGRRPFDLARETLGSKVEPVVADFMTTDLEALGRFDVVLYLGVLYHMKEPLTALTRLRNVTGEVAVIETDGLSLLGHRDLALLRFYPGNELDNDFGNWFGMSEAALHGLCRAAGFSRSQTIIGERAPSRRIPRVLYDIGTTLRRRQLPVRGYRLIVHAFP